MSDEPKKRERTPHAESSVWVVTIIAVDRMCYAEGPDVRTLVYCYVDDAVEYAKNWYVRFTSDDEDEAETRHVLATLEMGRYISLERDTIDLEISIREKPVL